MAGCDPQSFFDKSLTLSNDLTKFAYFDTISKDHFEDMKNSGSLGATIPIEGVPIDFNMSYDDAKKLMDILREAKQINYTEVHQKTILTSILSSNGLDAYKACVAAKGGVGTFLSMSPNAATANHFFIGVKWQGGVGGPEGKFDYVGPSPFQVIGGTVVGPYETTPPTTIKSGEEISVEIERDLSQDFQFTTAVNGNSPDDKIYLPKFQPRSVIFNVRHSETVTSSSSVGGLDDDDKRPVLLAGTNERFLPSTAVIVGHTDGPHSEIRIIGAEPLRILWRVWAQRATNEQGAFARGYVSVISVTWK